MSLRDRLDDGLSPIMIKELRQGLKAKSFIVIFGLVQLALIVSTILALDSDRSSWDSANAIFWTAVIGLVGLGLPMSAINALHSEVKQRTFELLLLTRMSAWRIVLGKWASVAVQVLLVSSAFLPYLVLRYYLGGVEIADEAVSLFRIVLGSLTVAALTVLASSYPQAPVRIGLVVTVAWLSLSTVTLFLAPGRVGVPMIWSWRESFLLIAAWLTLVLLMIDWAASRLAPPAENHARVKRGLASLLMAIAWVCHLTAETPDLGNVLLWIGSVVLMLVSFDACLEAAPVLVGLVRPYSRVPGLGRIAALFSLPGWPSGAVFAMFAAIAIAFTHASISGAHPGRSAILGLALIGFFAIPLACAVLLGKMPKSAVPFFAAFIAWNLIGILIGAVFDSANWISLEDAPLLWAVLPLALAVASAVPNGEVSVTPESFALLAVIVAVSLIVVARASTPYWRAARTILAERGRVARDP